MKTSPSVLPENKDNLVPEKIYFSCKIHFNWIFKLYLNLKEYKLFIAKTISVSFLSFGYIWTCYLFEILKLVLNKTHVLTKLFVWKKYFKRSVARSVIYHYVSSALEWYVLPCLALLQYCLSPSPFFPTTKAINYPPLKQVYTSNELYFLAQMT